MKIYVYEIWNPLKSQPFYVGVTNNITKRKYRHINEALRYEAKRRVCKRTNGHKANTILQILKSNQEIQLKVVYTTDSYDDALKEEIRLINLYGRRDDGGILTNILEGGQGTIGVSGRKISPAERKAHSARLKGRKRKPLSQESKLKMSRSRKIGYSTGKIKKPVISNETRLKARISIIKTLSREIYAIEADGKIFGKFPSASEASRQINKSEKRSCNIATAASKNKWHRSYGYYWRYVDEYDSNEDFRALTERLSRERSERRRLDWLKRKSLHK